jgi:hypothetical protein
MAIENVLASVAVKDLNTAVLWYEKVFGRPADATPMPGLAEWKFPGGGWHRFMRSRNAPDVALVRWRSPISTK